jgi:hypothetical protein
MKIDTTEQKGESKAALEHCAEILGEIAATCCMPQRSTHMDAAFQELQQALSALTLTRSDHSAVHQCIDGIGQFGARVGFLYATCCTDVREPLYQRLFKEMNRAHGLLWMVQGHSH